MGADTGMAGFSARSGISQAVLWMALLAYTGAAAVNPYCYTKDTNPYRLYATKTSYGVARGRTKYQSPAGRIQDL